MPAPRRSPRAAKGECPVCRKAVAPGNRFVPFCTERCKMVDLGRWFRGEYVVAGEDAIALDPEELEEHLRHVQERSAREADGGETKSDE